jgi:hypothetical protein
MATIDDRGGRETGGALDPRDGQSDHDGSRRIERVLRQDETLEPSGGFSLRVMAAVRQEAALPPPIAFPWRRLLAGISACAALTATGGALLVHSASHLRLPALPDLPPPWLSLPALEPSALLASQSGALELTAAALAGSYLLTRLARHLVKI